MKRFKMIIMLLLALYSRLSFGQPQAISVQHLQVEGGTVTSGITVKHPRLSWQIKTMMRWVVQTDYELLFSSSLANLNKNNGDVWSGTIVHSDSSLNVKYPVSNLLSCRKYFWKVRVRTNRGNSPWSKPASFSMGIVDAVLWKASWVGTNSFAPSDDPRNIHSRLAARYIRKEFNVKKLPLRATAYISGLGLYELYVNGHRVGNSVLAPAPMAYDKVLPYNTLDITGYLKKGNNAIGVILGNGRYFSMRYNADGGMVNGISSSANYGFPVLLMQIQLEYKDFINDWIYTDSTWRISVDGPIRANNEFDGEEYDERKEMSGWLFTGYSDKDWRRVDVQAAPSALMVSQQNENIAIMDSLTPLSLWKTSRGTYIVDMGQNMVGWLSARIKATRGDSVMFTFSETLVKSRDSLYMDNIRSARVTDKYIFNSHGYRNWSPRFVYHGFRFVEIKGLNYVPEKTDFSGQVLYDRMATTGKVYTSNKVLNEVYNNAYWSVIGNYRGMPTDCPQRDERMGWLGDRTENSYGETYMVGNALLYRKWMDDIAAEQLPSGSLPDVAPAYWKVYSDNVSWPITYIVVPGMLRKQFGDEETLIRHYPFMKKWVLYMWNTYRSGNLVKRDKYGDWCLPPESLDSIFSRDSTRITSGELIGAAYFYYAVSAMKQYAEWLGIREDIPRFLEMTNTMHTAFNQTFYNKDSGYYANNTVTSNLLPLTFGLVEEANREKVQTRIVSRTEKMYSSHVSTGLIGSQWLMRGLSNAGRPDLAFKIATNTTYPSWGYMKEQGATTIWELWNGNTANPAMNSGNHVMLLGDFLVWMYENIGGIRSDTGEIAFKKILFEPYFSTRLQFADITTASPYGVIRSHWRKDRNKIIWNIEVPANSHAEVHLPGIDLQHILESGNTISGRQDMKCTQLQNKTLVEIGSGNYLFSFTL